MEQKSEGATTNREELDNTYEDSHSFEQVSKTEIDKVLDECIMKKSITKDKKARSVQKIALFPWKIWDKRFSSSGLGGHMSRAHPGKSNIYRRKRTVRATRKQNLLLLREAQRIYKIKYGCPEIKNINMNRKKVLEIKRMLELSLE